MILLVLTRIIVFLKTNLDYWTWFFTVRTNNIIKEYLPKDFEYESVQLTMRESWWCQRINKGKFSCKKINRVSIRKDGLGNETRVYSTFGRKLFWLDISYLAVESNFESVAESARKYGSWELEDFEIIIWSGYDQLYEFVY